MKTKLRRILDHITRSWEDEPEPPHPKDEDTTSFCLGAATISYGWRHPLPARTIPLP